MSAIETANVRALQEVKLGAALTWWSLGLIALLIALSFFVYGGWHRIYQPDLGATWAIAAAAGTVVVSWGLVWGIGRLKGHELAGPRAAQLPRWLTVAAMGLLIFISAWGTANTLLMIGESSAIYRETLDKGSQNLSQLRAAADKALVSPDYEKLKGRVGNAWASARKQLTTVAYCGEGSNFKALLRPVEQELGVSSLYALGGSALRYSAEQCQTSAAKQAIAQRAQEYDELIREKLLQSEVAIRDKVADRSVLKGELQRDIDQALAELTATQNTLRINVDRSEILQRLTDANAVFVRYRAALAEINKDQVKSLPESLDLKMANGLGSISQSFGIFMARFGDVWLYVAVAIGFDFLIAWVAYRRGKEQLAVKKSLAAFDAAHHAEIEQAKAFEAERIRQEQTRKIYRVKHLWVPATSGAANTAR